MIYVMRVRDRWKVGYSSDPVERAYQLSHQHGWCDVSLVALGIGTESDEAAIHAALAPLRARERNREREYYSDGQTFRLWHDAVDAFWRGNEVFRTERRRGIVTRPAVAGSLRSAIRAGRRRIWHGPSCFSQEHRLNWHVTAEQVLNGQLRRGSVGDDRAATATLTLPTESARHRMNTLLYGPMSSGPSLAPIPHAWLVRAGALRVSFRCTQCRSRHTVPFPDRTACYGLVDPTTTAASILFGAVGPPSVAHHRGTLERALRIAAADGVARMGLPNVVPSSTDEVPIEVFIEETATDFVGLGSDAHPSRVEARVRSDDPEPVATLQRLWRGSPQERHAEAVVALARERWVSQKARIGPHA